MLERFGLWRARNERAATFSRGMLQRLALCRTFLHDPDLLLLDEPFDGLDVEGADLLQAELAARSGVTALVATHDPEALAARASARLAIA
jgi:ABC-type multidrug transport system ATPase subunit